MEHSINTGISYASVRNEHVVTLVYTPLPSSLSLPFDY
jgi:hypothetical protein